MRERRTTNKPDVEWNRRKLCRPVLPSREGACRTHIMQEPHPIVFVHVVRREWVRRPSVHMRCTLGEAPLEFASNAQERRRVECFVGQARARRAPEGGWRRVK